MKRIIALVCCLVAINMAMAETPTVGDKYIDITLETADNQNASISELLADGKWVLLDFWATWCGPCRKEIPHLVAAYEKYASKGLEIYGVTLDNIPEQWKLFISDNDMTWINVWGLNANGECPAATAYGVEYIPTNFLISPEGIIVATNLRGKNVENVLASILGK